MLDPAPRACLKVLGCNLEDEEYRSPFEKIRKAPDLIFDAIVICGGPAVLPKDLKDVGLAVSIPLDLSYSPHFNLCNIDLVNWIFHMIKSRRVKAVILEPPCASFSPAQHPASRSYSQPLGFDRLDKKAWLGNCLAFRCLAILWYAWSHEIIGLLEQPHLSKMSRLNPWKYLLSLGLQEAIVASCQFSSIRRKEFKLTRAGIEMSKLDVRCPGGHSHVRIEGKFTKPSAVYAPQLASFLAGHLRDAIIGLEKRWEDFDAEPGYESVIINDCLTHGDWKVGKTWEWEKPAHINVFESRSYVELLKDLFGEGGRVRFVCLLDSRVAKGAHAKGRSSSTSFRPSLYNRACAFAVAGNLHPYLGFAPARLNTADRPTRDKDLPVVALHSVIDFLNESEVASLHSTQLSRPSASWIRLFILASCCLSSRASEAYDTEVCVDESISIKLPSFSQPVCAQSVVPQSDWLCSGLCWIFVLHLLDFVQPPPCLGGFSSCLASVTLLVCVLALGLP